MTESSDVELVSRDASPKAGSAPVGVLPMRMNVAHVTETFHPRVGGIETALSTLIAALHDVDHVVFTNFGSGSPSFERTASNLTIRRIPPDEDMLWRIVTSLPGARAGSPPANALPLACHILRESVRRRRIRGTRPAPNLIHMHSAARARYFLNLDRKYGLRLGSSIVRRWLDPDAYGVPTVLTDHSLFGGPRTQFDSTQAGFVVRELHNVVCVERSGYENVIAYAREEGLSIRIWHIPNPVDLRRFQPRPFPQEDRLVVGYAGRVDKSGLPEVLKVARLAPPQFRFRLALSGDPSVIQELRATASQHVEIRANVPNEEMADFYGAIHVLLDPYEFGVPRTSIEALASGRAVVRSRSAPDSGRDLDPALSPLVPRDPESILQTLEEFRSNPDMLERLGRLSRAAAAETYDVERVADAYRSVYREVASPD